MKTTYIALLRGVNVGGKNMIKMGDLQTAVSAGGFTNARTYIQSGNIIFESNSNNKHLIAEKLRKLITATFGISVDIALYTSAEWQEIIKNAPAWWGKDTTWKHNLIALIEPYAIENVVAAVGRLKPDIEKMSPGKGVIYQSLSLKMFGRTTGGKLASNPIYKRMTLRNFNTAQKLAIVSQEQA